MPQRARDTQFLLAPQDAVLKGSAAVRFEPEFRLVCEIRVLQGPKELNCQGYLRSRDHAH